MSHDGSLSGKKAFRLVFSQALKEASDRSRVIDRLNEALKDLDKANKRIVGLNTNLLDAEERIAMLEAALEKKGKDPAKLMRDAALVQVARRAINKTKT